MQRRQRWPHALARGHPRNSYHARVRRTYPPVVACRIFWALVLLSKAVRKCVVVLCVSFFGCSSALSPAPDRDRYYSTQGASGGGIEVYCVCMGFSLLLKACGGSFLCELRPLSSPRTSVSVCAWGMFRVSGRWESVVWGHPTASCRSVSGAFRSFAISPQRWNIRL